MTPRRLVATAAALGLAAAVSLGLSRFAYALLLPPMRAELGWSYFTAGAMNTVNAADYLAGALLVPPAFRRVDARTVMLVGGAAAALPASSSPRGDTCRSRRGTSSAPIRSPSALTVCIVPAVR